jgi:hypothetical protein
MADTRRRAVPASKFRVGVLVAGAIDGVNMVFTTPDTFKHDPPNTAIQFYYNGQRLLETDDYTVTGPASLQGDTVTTLFAPKPGDKLWADYIAV